MTIFRFTIRWLSLAWLAASAASAQVSDPRVTSWLTSRSAQYARIYETTAAKTAGTTVTTWPGAGLTNGGGGISTASYSDIQRVAYSTNFVYIYTTGLASYTMGNWLTPNNMTYTSWPANRAAIHRIPRNPSIPATKQRNNGNGGVLVNGVFVWQNGDAQSYSTTTGTVSMGGQGIWNRLAAVAEAFNFDPANGHQPSSGAYHNHVNPKALRYQLGDNVTYNSSSKAYSESGAPTKHSPIIGWANDGLPIYGPYGYSSAMDSTSGLRRMTTGFQKRDGTNGTVNLASTGRITLPVWAASVQGRSQTLSSSEYGPNTTTTYNVGGGVTATYSIGTFAEDYEYLGDLGKIQGIDFDLNRQNVRFCVTPEFPGGTYAYFVCIDSSGATVFPDMINQEYFGSAAVGQGTVNSISESVTDYVDAGPAATINVTATASGGNVALGWNSAEGATYKVESSPDSSTWTILSSAVTSGSLTTNYTATTSTNYYRVTLTAIASYDTGGTFGVPVGKTATVLFGTAATAPSITTQPASATVTAGTSVTLTVGASGSATLSYQWKKGGGAISGATNASYTIASPLVSDGGSYTVTVTNSVGSVTSNAVTLTVNAATTAPTITTQPVGVTTAIGGNVTFTIVASGTAPLSYRWRKDGVAISGATAATYSMANAQATDAGNYTCVVTNGVGSIVSAGAALTVTTNVVAPTITAQPLSATTTAGGSATFGVVASGTALNYQWRKDGVSIAGAIGANITIVNAQVADIGSYTCVVSNTAGFVTSNAAALTLTARAVAPVVTVPPASATVATGSGVTFTVSTSGTSPLAYQWRKDGAAIAGATSAAFTLASAQANDSGGYTVVVTNSAGSATSPVATLTVNAVSQPTARIVNLAVRTRVGGGAGTPAVGFVMNGAGGGKPIVVRAVGPTLCSFGVTEALAETHLQLWSNGAMLAGNDRWLASDASAFTAVGAFPLNAGSSDSAIVSTLAPGAYSTPVEGAPGASGTVLIECYDGAPADTSARLVNASAIANVGTGDDVLIPGFVISGEGTVRILVRAVGPGLAPFGLNNALADPQLTLYRGSTASDANDDWGLAANATEIAAAASAVGAFALAKNSHDAALVVSLSAGSYSATVSGVAGTTGTALVEVYVVP